ncbi:MAG: AAA family ATPase [Okeania sp. SIO3I5]|uniref:AAA family ATPase n=1 Tax=Okeania sp. SIO3I5 TaxID=2607805 RepID=UPI0013BB2F7D|nr:AAA family ATPase [Okeania sp. SIO3I5]NEQ38779.1 AAA family ATPase [Okeania sp. SIO3I5]
MSIKITSLTNYEIGDLIHESERTLVYQGVTKVDSEPVIIKLMQNQFPDFNELVQFRNQYTIARNLSLEGIVKPLELLSCQNGYALVMPDFGGISLGEYYQNFSPCQAKDISQFLDIAIQITEILQVLHQNRIIHKDIKPANILINPETKQVKIIDFSISTLLPKETKTIQTPNSLEGTLAYISPEQTGRMNRGIDYRSDFYSLGVTFFEILNGVLPFDTTDPMELVHCHLAKMPILGSREGRTQIPQMLINIVMKLMAKNAEDRYQSALGLKFDLEKCREEWQQKGKIEYFELGSRDISDRFLIPEKLYGRDAEVQQLLAAFERVASPQEKQVASGKSELILVAGFSGIGKTAVVNEVHKPIVRQRGYFIKGKFDQFNRNIPFSALVESLRDLMGQLLSESDTQLQQWKSQILNAVGENGQVIIEVIPELEKIIGKQPAVPELSGSAAQNRFNLLFGKFIQVFTTKEHPLVIFLDDLQWADSASLNLMKLLMSQGERGYLLLIGAYRDNEVFPAHPLMLTLDEIRKADATINTITLMPLSLENINHLVVDTLICAREVAQPLTELVYQKTKGNPFFTTQFLLGLYGDELIKFNREVGYWECDITKVKQKALTDDVVEFMAARLQKLPTETIEVLKLAACIGNQFDLKTLAIVCQQSETETSTALWRALQLGFILPQSEVYKFYFDQEQQQQFSQGEISELVNYKFLHDRVQQAAYSLILEADKQATHLKIGQFLLSQTSSQEQEEKLFTIVNQLNIGRELLSTEAELNRLARLNLQAGQKAKLSTAYAAAIDYLNIARQLLPWDSWENNYDITLEIFVEALEAEYLNTNFDQVEILAANILEHTRTVLDAIKVYEVKIRAWIGCGDQHQALETGLYVLKLLKISLLEEKPDSVADVARLIDAPEMADPYKLAAMSIMAYIVTPAWAVSPDDFRHITFTMVDLSLRYGNCAASSFGYVWYGTLLCEALGNIDEGYEFGRLSVALLDRFNARELRSKVLVLYASCIGFWKEHVKEFLSVHLEGLQSGLETGDFEFACYGAAEYSQYLFLVGLPLEEVKNESQQKLSLIQHLKQSFHVDYLAPWLQGTLNLMGESESSATLNGPIYNEEDRLQTLVEQKQLTTVFVAYFVKSFLSYLFGDAVQAVKDGNSARDSSAGVAGTLFIPAELFYSSLARIACLGSVDPCQQKSERQNVNECLAKLKHWANYAPMNYQHKCDLLAAELAKHDSLFMVAMDLYDKAIAGAKENEYIQEEGLANELAAKFYLEWGKEKIACIYMQEAYYCYSRWGAKAKTDDLEKRYPNLLTPILEQAAQTLYPLETLSTLTQESISIHNFITTTHSSSSSINSTLDFAAVLKAHQTLSGTIEFDELLRQLTQIILQYSGGDRCALIISDEVGEWQVRAIAQPSQREIATPEEIQFCTEPLNKAQNIPVKLIQYVKNTHETVVIDDLETDLPVLDDYLRQHQPQSVLGLPMLNQGRCIGIVCLENRIASGVFTGDSITLLNFFCTQAAISIQNSLLYQKLEYSLLKTQKTSQELVELVALSQGEQRILALIAQGLPLTQMLSETAIYIENQSRHAAYCSFLLLDAGGRLRHLAAPSLPSDYNDLIDGIAIGPDVGSCGTAAYRKASVTVTNIATDPLWVNFQIALDFGLRACTSTPILGGEGQVLATLAMYQPEPGEFTLHDRQLMEVGTYLARIAIERHQADIELQQLNLQMIQGEKMATLGNLVAGVAHEVNNPIGFLDGSVENAKDYVQNIFEYLDTYQSEHPANELLQKSAEEIELEFMREDFPKLLKSMQNATNRIKGISTSIRTFSRADTEHKVSACLHEGLNSTLLILKYRLQASEKRPGIEVVKNYGDLPNIDCFPGQLNQVFMNILANAVDMFDEFAQEMTLEDLKSNPQKITIQTANLAEQNAVEILISDNGKGMPDEVKSKIFDHLFTTKEVGKGTGLGLAIAKQIIEEKHGGAIDCISELGKGTKFIITLPVDPKSFLTEDVQP